ncbi:GNAT family N-acetyltransferase [Herbidospora cretacea]|uniref:GNAT family N-acetyltransferase n=1 Tax=Herbidospora cretacea TaxID=28444 RepID=UPI000773DDFD|nr:GNAT family N-acetyltransferase [Herbidospora cretacea]
MGVRPARLEDVDAVTSTQIRAWKHGYRDFLPPGPLQQMTGPAAEKMWRRQWDEAILSPPSPRHRVLVAVERVVPDTEEWRALGPGGVLAALPTANERASDRVVGLASHGPAEDPDLHPGFTAELLTLLVDPNHIRRGHGSRLLNATVDHLRDDNYSSVVTWVFAENYAMLGFLESAGWGEDMAERVLDMGRPIRMVRMTTDISRA